MTRLIGFLTLIAAFLAPIAASATGEIGALPQRPSANADEAAIHKLLDDFAIAADRADGPGYFAAFAPNGVFVGTDASERWTLPEFRAFAEPYFAKGTGWTYIPLARHITFSDVPCGCVAWFEEELMSPSYGTTRGTGVVIRDAAGWKIAQYVLTIPIPNDMAKDVVRDIKAFEAARAHPPTIIREH